MEVLVFRRDTSGERSGIGESDHRYARSCHTRCASFPIFQARLALYLRLTLLACDMHLSHNGSGSHVSPLSLLPLGDSPFDAQYLKPYDPKIHLRSSIPISAIPFSISPFDVMELARNSAPARVRLTTRGGGEFWVSAKHDIRELIVSRANHYECVRNAN